MHRHCTDIARTLHGHGTDTARTRHGRAWTCTDMRVHDTDVHGHARTMHGHHVHALTTNKYNIIHGMFVYFAGVTVHLRKYFLHLVTRAAVPDLRLGEDRLGNVCS